MFRDLCKLGLVAGALTTSLACTMDYKVSAIGDGELNILVIYASDVTHPKGRAAFAQHLVDEVQSTLNYSGIDRDVHLSDVFVHDDDSTTMGADFDERLETLLDDADIDAAQRETDSDLVVVLVSPVSIPGSNTRTTGLAYRTYGDHYFDVETSTTVVDVTSPRSFVHEVGHLLGASHDVGASNPCESEVDYGCGYVQPSGQARSVMAYGTACSTCTQVPLFSNPYVTVGGHVMGDADAAYNACVVHQLFDYVARFDGVLTGDDYWAPEFLSETCTSPLSDTTDDPVWDTAVD